MSDWMMGTLADNDADESRSAMEDADYLDLDFPSDAELAEMDEELRNAVPAPLDPTSPWAVTSFIGPIEPPPF